MHRCIGAEVQRCIGALVHRCIVAEVQMQKCRGGVEVQQRKCRGADAGAEVQRYR